MSSILIKNMEMPNNCWACACYHHKVNDGYYDYDVCRASGTVFNDGYASVTGHKDHIDPFKQTLDNCPLVPVPPHGRLIDADALLERFEKEEKAADEHGRDFSFSFKSGGENCTEWWPVQQMLMDAPTIIEAEEGE